MTSPADLTLEQAAEHLCVPATTLAEWRAAGTGPPALHVGRTVRYRASDLTAWSRTMFGTQVPARSNAVTAAAKALVPGEWENLSQETQQRALDAATRVLTAAASAGWDPVADLPVMRQSKAV